MKRSNLAMLGITIGLLLAPVLALAGQGKGLGCWGDLWDDSSDGLGLPGGFGFPGQGLRHLSLTQEQRETIAAILAAERETVRKLRQQLADNRRAFRSSHPPTQFNESAVRAHVAEQAKIHAELAVVVARTRAQVLALLTPEQREKLADLTARWEERWSARQRRWKGMGGSGGK